MMLPSTLAEIRNIASAIFKNPAALSTNINTTFGMITIFRNGDIIQTKDFTC